MTMFQDATTLASGERPLSTEPSKAGSHLASLTAAVQTYFDLMYDCDISRFDEVFRSTAHLHGFRDGQMVAWSAPLYKDILAERQSPQSCGAVRADKILLIDIASPGMAFVKVRVRIHTTVFVDYLTWHHVDGTWLVTSKGFHLESEGEPGHA